MVVQQFSAIIIVKAVYWIFQKHSFMQACHVQIQPHWANSMKLVNDKDGKNFDYRESRIRPGKFKINKRSRQNQT